MKYNHLLQKYEILMKTEKFKITVRAIALQIK
jgi:hypothetical protein